MLQVTIELVPGGFSPLRRTIATMRVSNASNLADVSDYRVEAMEAQNPLTGSPAYNADCIVAAHDSRQTIWKLLERACREIAEADRVEL
jgi:hypothetical protein